MDAIDPALLEHVRSSDTAYAGIAFNEQCTLFARVNTDFGSVFIRSTARGCIERQFGCAGPPEERLVCPSRICFVQAPTETVLITDPGALRISEFTVSGEFLRSIPAPVLAVGQYSMAGISYSPLGGMVAVACMQHVALLDYVSGAV